MSKFMIYQNSLRTISTELNAIGSWTIAAQRFTKVNTHLECTCKGSEGFEPKMFRDYEKVAIITADDLDEVFQTGNIGPERNIQRFKAMHSLSVGDIVRDSDQRFFMVDSCGFGEITNSVRASRQPKSFCSNLAFTGEEKISRKHSVNLAS